MRTLRLALLVAIVGVAGTAGAQSVYGDGDDEPYDDWPDFRGQAPAPTPAPPAAPPSGSPYELLPSEPPGAPAPPAAEAPAAQLWRYNGPHAINAEYGQGWCNIQGPHDHPYPPFDDHLFQEDRGGYDFLGDPADFGYAGDMFWYNGPHPIAAGFGLGWCYITWPHRHIYRPFGVYFSACGPYSCYYGPFDAWYWYWRPYWAGYWGGYYPHYYRGGRYYRTGVAASPGRWAGVNRGPGGQRYGAPAGRAGGYARPVAPLPRYGRSVTIPHGPTAIRPRALPAPARAYSGPRAMPVPPRAYAGPRSWAPPGSYAGRPMPRSYAMPRPAFAPRWGGSTSPAPRMAAPPAASMARPAAPAPSGGFRGGFHGGGGRHR